MNDDKDRIIKSTQDQIREYRKLQEVANDEAFEAFFDLQIKTVAEKLLWAFTTHVEKTSGGTKKIVDNVNSWEEFLKVRAEIIARLHPIQEVYGAEPMIKYLLEQLEQYKQQD